MKRLILFFGLLIFSISLFGQTWKPDYTKKEFKDSVNFDKGLQIGGVRMTRTAAQLNYVDVNSGIQGLLNAKVTFPGFGTSHSTSAYGDHAHGNITNAGAIGSTANLPLITTTSGVLTTGSFGTGATDFTAGNDSRLSDARTPVAHNQAVSTISDATTIGQNFVKLTNPSAITFPRINANNTLDALSASDFRTAIGAGTGGGTVTSIATGLGLSGGTITGTGTLLVDTTNASILSRQRASHEYQAKASTVVGSTLYVLLADSANGGGADKSYVSGKDYKTDKATFVPYTGATTNVDIGANTLTAKNVIEPSYPITSIDPAVGFTAAMIAHSTVWVDLNAPIDITANPQIPAGVDGQKLIIIGYSNTNTLTLDTNNGLFLTGTIVLGDTDVLILQYITEWGGWIEIGYINHP